MRASVLVNGVVALALAGIVPAAASVRQAATAATSLVFDRVTVVDVEHGKLRPDQRVVVAGNRIQAVGSGRSVKMPKGAQVVDARGKYLIPGLWDMHVHPVYYPDFIFPLLVAHGVTGIRDAGSLVPIDTLVQWRREVLAGTLVGPPRQLLSAQYIRQQSPACRRDRSSIGTCVVDSADALHYIDSLKAAGTDMIKLHGVPPPFFFFVATEARRRGLPIGGHVYYPDRREGMDGRIPAIPASDSGIGIFDHTESGKLDSLCMGPFASLEACQPVAERFRRNNTWWVPTLIHIRWTPVAHSEVLRRWVREFSTKFWTDTTFHTTLAQDPRIHGIDSSANHPTTGSRGSLSIARRAGMPMMTGSDAAPPWLSTELAGATIHAELAMFVAEGMTPLEALQTATLNPAKFLRGTDSLGTVAAGKLADLVLLDANPLVNIANVGAIRAVIANGRYYDRAKLDQLLAEVQVKAQLEPQPQWSRSRRVKP